MVPEPAGRRPRGWHVLHRLDGALDSVPRSGAVHDLGERGDDGHARHRAALLRPDRRGVLGVGDDGDFIPMTDESLIPLEETDGMHSWFAGQSRRLGIDPRISTLAETKAT